MIELTDIIEFYSDMKNALSDDGVSIVKVLDRINKLPKTISDKLFYINFSKVVEGLDAHGTCSRKVGKKLAESSYGEEYGFVLLKYIDLFEHPTKGMFLANLMDSVSKDFISPEKCFIYGKMISSISLASLNYLKDNICHGVCSIKDELILLELERYNLVYVCKEDTEKRAYTKVAYSLDKFALSYTHERYNYNGDKDFVPSEEQMPKAIVHLVN